MPIFRGLLLIAAVWLVVVIFRQLYRAHRAQTSTALGSDYAKINYIETVSCKTCGLRIPKTEAITNNNHYFCCHQHKGQKNHANGDNAE